MTLDEIIEKALAEDLGDGDHTSHSTIPADAKGKARLMIKEDGIIAGIRIARRVFQLVDSTITFEQLIEDGARVKYGDIAFRVSGPSISLLSSERLALNFMQRICGIATYTNIVTEQIAGTSARVLDTRKTTPLLRALEKEAVRLGGGENHRMGPQ